MRLFVALLPPAHLVAELDALLDPRREAGAELRWSDPEQWHLTLAFMAEAPSHRLDDLVAGLEAAAGRQRPLDLVLGGGGAFPDPFAAKVLWLGVGEVGAPTQSGLTALASATRAVCSGAGCAPAGGPFRPHLSVARVPRPTNATRWLRILDGFPPLSWPVDRVSLVESHLGQGRGRRPRYAVVADFPLGTRS